jgi:hypothetical protein
MISGGSKQELPFLSVHFSTARFLGRGSDSREVNRVLQIAIVPVYPVFHSQSLVDDDDDEQILTDFQDLSREI